MTLTVEDREPPTVACPEELVMDVSELEAGVLEAGRRLLDIDIPSYGLSYSMAGGLDRDCRISLHGAVCSTCAAPYSSV